MKKRLEAELISIAHRILKLKNKSDLKQLHFETQKLYEALSVLKFVEENNSSIYPKMNQEEIENKLEISLNNNFAFENEPIIEEKQIEVLEENFAFANEPITEEKSIEILEENFAISNEPITEEKNIEVLEENFATANEPITEEKLAFIPDFEPEKQQTEEIEKQMPIEISFDEFKFEEPIFERKLDLEKNRTTTLNEKLIQGINIGLNDKVAFVKHLFAESDTDYNRVLSQISTFDTFLETTNFINEIVKPDYNNWENKDEYVVRFLEAVEKKFI